MMNCGHTPPPSQSRVPRFPWWRNERLALHEGIAIYGLVLAFLNANAQEMLPFGAAAIVLNLFALPRNPPKEE